MSVLVKGIDMPKSCRECHFIAISYNMPVCFITKQIPTYPLSETLEQALSKRMNGCPLEEVTEEARHGRWIIHGSAPWLVVECSNCGAKWHHWSGERTNNYCGNCGAKMDEVKE